MNLFPDIETIPGQAPWVREHIASTITHPGNMSNPDTIAKWEAEKKEGEIEKKWLDTAKKDGTLAEIYCIGIAVDDGEPVVLSRCGEAGQSLSRYSERDLLLEFIGWLSHICSRKDGGYLEPTWIGHNISVFDIPFLWQRCVINGVKTHGLIPIREKSWSYRIFDTCKEWKGFGNASASLNVLCKAFGIETKGDLDGSKVWEYIQAGRYEEVNEYCKQDVLRHREVYERMSNG